MPQAQALLMSFCKIFYCINHIIINNEMHLYFTHSVTFPEDMW